MPAKRVYMDHHATTPVDPRVVQAMLPYFTDKFGNPGSVSHGFGWEAKEGVDAARQSIAAGIGAGAREIVFTSGATESNNLAIRGLAERARGGKHIVSVTTEHKAVLDPLERLGRRGYEITWLPVIQAGNPRAGCIDAGQVADALRDDTLLVSVMLANNEMGAIHPLEEIGTVCRERGILLHCDATQGVGRIPVDVAGLGVDLMSFSGHKMYGPKGVGVLYVRRRGRPVRLAAQIDGGGQEGGFRSGTLNVPGIVGMAAALELCLAQLSDEAERLARLRDRLFEGLSAALEDVSLNGPDLVRTDCRLSANLNVSFADVDGEALLMSMRDLAVSSGSACTSANPQPSHVLRAMGLSEDLTRASLRFGLGRQNTAEDVEFAISTVSEAVRRLRRMRSPA